MTFVLTITLTCQFFVITTCNLTRSPRGEFLSAFFFSRRGIFVEEWFWSEGGFCWRRFLAGGGFLLKGGFSQRGILSGGGFCV